ncbi:hypothetical protein Poli38472_002582 [Pythium oligandrum]|uniref:Coiled-coil domain-containing protein 47 n=1 Tax=Pythium oligandrum TaxID=41045 RepID=A0A8K1CJ11_PYTOL|nr:hypothetical protein Poli38472_002582 [Pythium oligandrum]|eukprot:TMW63641.1 hypothetical protein Poli38472_002582 [Pythium oligandrum]
MRLALIIVYAVLALACAQLAVAQEADEFDGVEPQTVTIPEVVEPTPSLFPEDNYYLEMGSWAIAILYVINYFIGRSSNRNVADKWLEEAEPELVKEFAYTGASAKSPVGLLEESKNNFKYYCTGRRFCSRLVVDIQTAARHDLFSRFFPGSDILTLDVGLNAADVDPFVLAISKKIQFNALTKEFPELISMAKRLPSNALPDSFCVACDNMETHNVALTKQLQNYLKELEPFLESIVITDVNTLPIIGLPQAEKHVLRVRFKMTNGSKKLDGAAAISLLAYLIDAIGSTIKVSRDVKFSAQKRRAKLAQEQAAAVEDKEEKMRRLLEAKEKKRQQYENLSYEEQQKLDQLQQKKQFRKRLNRKK